MTVEKRRNRAHIDMPLILLVAVISIFGLFCVAVATYSTTSDPDASKLEFILRSDSAAKQFLYLMVSPIVVLAVMGIPYDFLRRYSTLAYVGVTVVVALVWVLNRAQGVKQWLDVIWGFTIQPTEFAKLALILMLAREICRTDEPMKDGRSFLRLALIVGVPGLIIIASGEMGSFLVIAFIFAVMIWFGRVKVRTMGVLVLLVALLFGALVAYATISGSDSYRLQRILAFIDPEKYASTAAYQQKQSQMAIGSGGLTGVGAFVDGTIYQLNYVPADWTDFIFATVGEAFGFYGCMGVITWYMLIILRMLWLGFNTRDRFGMLVICGVTGMLVFHVIENVGMTIGVLPITGIPLPFLSYGGSNMVTNMAGVGLVLNVTRNRAMTTVIPEAQRRFGKRRRWRL